MVQIGAGALGLIVAGFVSYRVGTSSGVDLGIATFVVSWTLIAVLVLLARYVTRRLLSSDETGTLPRASVPAERTPPPSGKSQRRRRRRRR